MRFTKGHTGVMLDENALRAGAVKFDFPVTFRKVPLYLLERHGSDAKYCEWLSRVVIKATLHISGYISEKLFCSKVTLPSTGQSPGYWGRLLK